MLFTKLLDVPAIAQVSDLFTAHDYTIAVVGGAVRDILLGQEPSDYDFTTDAPVEEIKSLLGTIADDLWAVGQEHGTIGARVAGEKIEVTTFRSGDSLEADLLERDLSLNAMAVLLPSLELIDPAGGERDIRNKLIREVSWASFRRDPIRMMRAARMVAQTNFRLDKKLRHRIQCLSATITTVADERIGEELAKILATDRPVRALRILLDTGVLDHVLPEIPALAMRQRKGWHHKDVLEHSFKVLQQAIRLEKARRPGSDPDLVLRMSALLHDIGKPNTRKFEDDHTVTFRNHAAVGAQMAKGRLKQLRFSNKFSDRVSRLVRFHMRAHGYDPAEATDSFIRRLVRDSGKHLWRLVILFRADVTSKRDEHREHMTRVHDALEAHIEQVQKSDAEAALRPDLNGSQVMEILDLTPGPQVGRAMKFLNELRIDEGPLDPGVAEERLRAWWAEAQA